MLEQYIERIIEAFNERNKHKYPEYILKQDIRAILKDVYSTGESKGYEQGKSDKYN